MNFSFKAKQALIEGKFTLSQEMYQNAAQLENEVVELYIDSPDLEPTRSIILRSAVFLNLKAGETEKAKILAMRALLSVNNKEIKEQLNDALELAISLKNQDNNLTSNSFLYLKQLRQHSINYILEPSTPYYGTSVSLKSLRDFSDGYLKSLNTFSEINYRKNISPINGSLGKLSEKLIEPLITQSAYGSFRFSVANDFIKRGDESPEEVEFKSNILHKYHEEIFTNPLTGNDIEIVKTKYTADEVSAIFRPLAKINSYNSKFIIGYYDSESFQKKYIKRIIHEQRKRLITINEISIDEIGELESLVIHKYSTQSGKTLKTTISSEKLTYYEKEIILDQIESAAHNPILLNESIIVEVIFDSNIGFTFSFSDLQIQNTDIKYQRGLQEFQNKVFERILNLLEKSPEKLSDDEIQQNMLIKKIINNPAALLAQ